MHSENIAAYIGLDVHKETLAVAIAAPERLGEVRYYGTINNEAQAVRRLFQKLQGLYGNILSCYEAGPCGFGLYHQLTAMNIKCQLLPLPGYQNHRQTESKMIIGTQFLLPGYCGLVNLPLSGSLT